MSPKTVRISPTSPAAAQDWRTVDVSVPSKAKGTAVFQTEQSGLIVTERRQASDTRLMMKMTVFVDPASASKRQAIKRLNDQLEGRASPADTYASKTAG